jgi:hypothetical protein
MAGIRMVLVTLVLVTGGVSALALVARLAARTDRRSTGSRFGSLGDRPGERSIGEGAGDEHDDRGPAGSPARLDKMRENGSPAELARRDDATVRSRRNPSGSVKRCRPLSRLIGVIASSGRG